MQQFLFLVAPMMMASNERLNGLAFHDPQRWIGLTCGGIWFGHSGQVFISNGEKVQQVFNAGVLECVDVVIAVEGNVGIEIEEGLRP